MNQVKVFEFAKEIGIETLVLMDKIREWQLPVKSHMATLDEETMNEIRDRLAQQEASRKPKKKVAKKTATRSGATSKAATKKAGAKNVGSAEKAPKSVRVARPAKASQIKAETTIDPLSEESASVETGGARSNVIRRKAGEMEQRALEAEAREQEEAAASEALSPHPDSSLEALDAPVASGVEGHGVEESQRPKRNIVGRMDLRRVAQAPSTVQRDVGVHREPVSRDGIPRPARTTGRNIRTGFYSAPHLSDPWVEEPERKEAHKEDSRVKKKATPKEEPQQVFTATEFRKREVIFQPKKKKSQLGREGRKTQITTPAAHKRVVKVHGVMTVTGLAQDMGVKASQLIKKLVSEGVMATSNTELDFDTIALIVPEFGFEAHNVDESIDEMLGKVAFGDLEAERVARPPVVTVMGHVDHGKTTLLDSIRKANVAKGEAGGITQHIGAYSVQLESGQPITFLDTPGHEAFTAMRARGAHVTDLAIIVVAADDGVMPQTVEAIHHAQAAQVPIIVAVNKMDKPGVNPDRIKQALTEYQLVPEEWGGTTIFCPVSALTGEGIGTLLEQILVVAEVQELKANPGRSAMGTIIESRMEKGRGVVATVLVQDGTLKVGQALVAGSVTGKVRSLMTDKGELVKEVAPGFPAELMGLSEPPMAGDRFDVCEDDESARKIALKRKSQVKADENPSSKLTLDQLFSKVKLGDVKELSVVLKADVAGSLEAVRGLLDKIESEEVKIKIIHSAIGGVTESDVLLASTANGIVLGFNVRPDTTATRLAKEKGVEIKSYTIIYELVDDMKKALSGLLSPEVREKDMGRAEVRNTFSVPKVGVIAGCFVVDGKIARNHLVRLVRDGKVVFEGKVGSLKRFKEDAREVASGFECGIGIENFNDIKIGDVIESFVREEHAKEL